MNFTTANAMIKLKLEHNKHIIDLLNIESKIAKLEMIIKMRLVIFNTNYIEDLNKINLIEKKQLYEYDLDREKLSRDMTSALNNRDVNISDIQLDTINLKNSFLSKLELINKLNECIPTSGFIANYKLM